MQHLQGWLTSGSPVLELFEKVACAMGLSIHVFVTSVLSLTEDFKVCLQKLYVSFSTSFSTLVGPMDRHF